MERDRSKQNIRDQFWMAKWDPNQLFNMKQIIGSMMVMVSLINCEWPSEKFKCIRVQLSVMLITML